jgi:hypothetical protein
MSASWPTYCCKRRLVPTRLFRKATWFRSYTTRKSPMVMGRSFLVRLAGAKLAQLHHEPIAKLFA